MAKQQYVLIDGQWVPTGGPAGPAGPAGTGGSGGGGGNVALTNDSVTNAYLANMGPKTLKGNSTTATGDPEDLTAAQAKQLLSLSKTDVGLSAVDNTADLAKPVSNPQQAMLNQKADLTYVVARTPPIVKSTTPPSDLTAIWVDIN